MSSGVRHHTHQLDRQLPNPLMDVPCSTVPFPPVPSATSATSCCGFLVRRLNFVSFLSHGLCDLCELLLGAHMDPQFPLGGLCALLSKHLHASWFNQCTFESHSTPTVCVHLRTSVRTSQPKHRLTFVSFLSQFLPFLDDHLLGALNECTALNDRTLPEPTDAIRLSAHPDRSP